MKVQEGAVVIAAMAGVPVLPITFSASRCRRARSWDRFMIALPFGRVFFHVGEPLHGATPEALEAAMVALTGKADDNVRGVS